MTKFAFPLAVLTSVSCLAPGASRAAEPTELEAFVAKSRVTIDFSQAIGTIKSKDAKVEVTALVAGDTADASQWMRSVRHVYLDESQLASVQSDLAGIDGGIAELEIGKGAPYRVQGTASCWMPARPQRI